MKNNILHTTPKGTIFIQPHSDDMVMSSYFLMKKEILPRPYYLLTVFGQSNWIDPIKKRSRLYAQKIDGTEVTRLRKTEDEKFAKSLNLILLFFNLGDCLLRNKKVYYQMNKKLDMDLVKEVKAVIYASIKKYKAENIVVPFPFGRRQTDTAFFKKIEKQWRVELLKMTSVQNLIFVIALFIMDVLARIIASVKIRFSCNPHIWKPVVTTKQSQPVPVVIPLKE